MPDFCDPTTARPITAHATTLRAVPAHLQLVGADVAGETFELVIVPGAESHVWEIGRSESCEIFLPDPSVSSRHAQLVHQNGRWRLVNLVSANGIYVNEEKRLTTYLADGDQIRLGTTKLVFHTAVGASAAQPSVNPAQAPGAAANEDVGGKSKVFVIAAGLALVVGLAILGWLIF